MKKLIRFTMMLLMITGVFIFAQGAKVEAATDTYDGFTVYSYSSSDTTHSLPNLYSEIDNMMIYVNGSLIWNSNYEFGDPSYFVFLDNVQITIVPDGTISMVFDGDDLVAFNSNGTIDHFVSNDVVFIVYDDPTSFQSWGYDTTDTHHNLPDDLVIENLRIYMNGIRVDNNPNYNIYKNIHSYLEIDETNEIVDITKFYNDEEPNSFIIDNLGGLATSIVIIEYLPPTEYTITFDTAGGTVISPVTATEGALLGEVIWDPGIVTTKDGYTFDDWYKNASYTIPVTETDTVTTNLTVYANWIQDIINYTITFNTVGGSYIAPEEIQENSTLSQPTDPYKDGYIFGGWFTDAFFLNAYDFNDPVTSNMTLYAQWTQLDADTSSDVNDWIANNILVVILGIAIIVIIFKR